MESDDHFKKQTEISPQYSHEVVFTLECDQCESIVCKRGMSAVLLANADIQLFSTDCPEECFSRLPLPLKNDTWPTVASDSTDEETNPDDDDAAPVTAMSIHRSLSEVATTSTLFLADNCECWLVNMACVHCGNCLGYNVRVPCRDCLSSSNNGHLWMFYVNSVTSYERLNYKGEEVLLWGKLNEDEEKQEEALNDPDLCNR